MDLSKLEVELVTMDDDYPDDPFSINEPGTVIFEVVTNHRPATEDPTVEVEVLDHWGCANWAQEGVGLEYFIMHQYCLIEKWMPEGSVWRIDEMDVSFTRGDGWVTDDDEDWDFNGPHLCAPWVLSAHRWHNRRKAWKAWLAAWWHETVAYRWRE